MTEGITVGAYRFHSPSEVLALSLSTPYQAVSRGSQPSEDVALSDSTRVTPSATPLSLREGVILCGIDAIGMALACLDVWMRLGDAEEQKQFCGEIETTPMYWIEAAAAKPVHLRDHRPWRETWPAWISADDWHRAQDRLFTALSALEGAGLVHAPRSSPPYLMLLTHGMNAEYWSARTLEGENAIRELTTRIRLLISFSGTEQSDRSLKEWSYALRGIVAVRTALERMVARIVAVEDKGRASNGRISIPRAIPSFDPPTSAWDD